MNPAAIVVLVIVGIIEAILIGILVWLIVEELIDQYQGWQRRRRERFEAELDRKAARLRRAVLEPARIAAILSRSFWGGDVASSRIAPSQVPLAVADSTTTASIAAPAARDRGACPASSVCGPATATVPILSNWERNGQHIT